ncbi:MAG TPA: hypothetical protein VJW77_02015 [Terriglobia bacterium]|nr:hypothetical protein [Terriglobia bacterium]
MDPSNVYNVSGTLDQYGDFALDIPLVDDNANCIEWLLLGSGDVTSQGLQGTAACTSGPTEYFLDGGMDSAEGSYYGFGVPPLFKSQTDLPLGESVASQGWATIPQSTLPTAVLWQRNITSMYVSFHFAGRFVYEQSGGAATDACYYGDPQGPAQVTSTVTGGGWFVDPNGNWGSDWIGMGSQADSFYQNHYGPNGQTCEITGPQDLWIDARKWPLSSVYDTTDTQMPAEITPTDLLVGLQPGGGQMVTACEPYPGLKGKCR